jgi:hypothetical protein
MARYYLLIVLVLASWAQAGTSNQNVVVGQEDELTAAEAAKRQKRREELREMLKSPVELVTADVRQLSVQERSEMRQQMRQQRSGPSR